MSNSLPNQKKLVLISEAAKILDVSIDTVRRWDKSGILHSQRLDGKNRYFSLDELKAHKSNQPLPISETARLLGVSAVTLRRLETRGLLKANRNNAGERVYDKDSLKNFLNSDYILRKKPIKTTPTEPLFPPPHVPTEKEASKPRSSMPDFLAISATVFLLLVTIGFGNIKLSEAKNTQPNVAPQLVLGTVQNAKAPGEIPLATPEAELEAALEAAPEATSEASLEEETETKIILKVKHNSQGSTVNIREQPSIDSKQVAKAKKGDTFEYISIDSGWYEVKLPDGLVGFISDQYVEIGKIE